MSGQPQTPHGLDLRQLLEDAYGYRDTLCDGYWCDRCDADPRDRCDDCQQDAEMRDAYSRALDELNGTT